jgi:hypothetical protein
MARSAVVQPECITLYVSDGSAMAGQSAARRSESKRKGSKVMLKSLMVAGALVGTLGLPGGMPGAQAMPVGNINGGDPQVILVYGGCGPYGHRGPYGGCQPGGQWGFPGGGGRGVSPIFGPYGGRWCPPGYHLGPYRGRCWPN